MRIRKLEAGVEALEGDDTHRRLRKHFTGLWSIVVGTGIVFEMPLHFPTNRYIAIGVLLSALLLFYWLFLRSPSFILVDGVPYPSDCFCGAENFCAEPFDDGVLPKRRFDCDLLPQLERFGLRDTDSVAEWKTMVEEVPIVSAASSDHFKLSRSWIRSLRRRHPTSPVIFWDLGLTAEERAEAAAWCGVEVKDFPYGEFPPHLKDPMNYAWKVAIKAMHFRESKLFVWEDASIRTTKKYNQTEYLSAVLNGTLEPYGAPIINVHSNFAATAPGFYDYFPMPDEVSMVFRMVAATTQYVTTTEFTKRVLKWELLCALTPDCIAPPTHRALPCEFPHPNYMTVYAKCHRYDQTLLDNVLLRKVLGVEDWATAMEYTKIVERAPKDLEKIAAKRRQRYSPYHEMFEVNREDGLNEPLKMECERSGLFGMLGKFLGL